MTLAVFGVLKKQLSPGDAATRSPSCRKISRESGRERRLHQKRIAPVGVIPHKGADDVEAQTLVEVDRAGVSGAHLQNAFLQANVLESLQEMPDQGHADPTPPELLFYRNGFDLAAVPRDRSRHVPHNGSRHLGHEEFIGMGSGKPPELGFGKGVERERRVLDGHDVLQVGRSEGSHHDARRLLVDHDPGKCHMKRP